MENYNLKVGKAIKYFRKLKNMTQQALVKHDKPYESIFSLKTLQRVERGKSAVTASNLKLLLSILDITQDEFDNHVGGQDLISFQNDFVEIWQLFFNGLYEEAKQDLEILRNKGYCDMNNPKIAQSVLLCEARIKVRHEKDFHGGLDILHEALRLTGPMLVSKDGKINHELMPQCVFTLNEYRILNMIAVVLDDVNERTLAIELLEKICKSLECKKIDSEIRNKFLPTTYHNLSELFLDEKRYKDAFNISEKGIEFCLRVHNSKMLGRLRYNKAESLYLDGSKGDGIIGFKKSYETFLINGQSESAEFIKNKVALEYGIIL